jgi:hypothetical protein
MGDQSVLTPRGAYTQGAGAPEADRQLGGVSNADTANASYAAQGQGSTGARINHSFGPFGYMTPIGKLNTDPESQGAIARLFGKGRTGRVFL